jgi:REP element-mobilizing transposase RayT
LSAHQLYFHLVWTTLNRRPMINAPTARWLDAFFRRTAINERVEVVELAILQTHVHMLIRTGERMDLGRLAQLLKGGSSFAASRLPENKVGLRWAREYSASTVSPGRLLDAIAYLRRQPQRHPDEVVTD